MRAARRKETRPRKQKRDEDKETSQKEGENRDGVRYGSLP